MARRRNQLEHLADEMAREHGCQVRAIECDLSEASFLDTLRPGLDGLDIGLLVNNAGFANTGALVDRS